MNALTLQERADLYRKAFPKFQPLSVVDGKWLEGLWIKEYGQCKNPEAKILGMEKLVASIKSAIKKQDELRD